jgi:hypothetical protein
MFQHVANVGNVEQRYGFEFGLYSPPPCLSDACHSFTVSRKLELTKLISVIRLFRAGNASELAVHVQDIVISTISYSAMKP